MKKTTRQIAVLALILLAVCVICRLAMRNTYTISMPLYGEPRVPGDDGMHLVMEEMDIIEPGAPERSAGSIRLPVRPKNPGKTFIYFVDAEENYLNGTLLYVSPLGTVYDTANGGFTGDSIALSAFTVFCLAVAAIMLRSYRDAKGPAFYSYATIFAVGFAVFSLSTGITMLAVTVQHLLDPETYYMLNAYSAISGAANRFILFTAPFMLVFAAAMTVSNVALLRHERFRLQNVLGIGVSLMLVTGEVLSWLLFSRGFSGSEWEWRINNTLVNVYCTVFAYFECMLIGAVICGIRAARHVPEMNADYILILGCRFRRDGTLTPLLRGRVDRALEFWHAQKQSGGGEAVLVPSGGQGSDEVMAEAEAMRRYLLEKNVPENAILVEDRSRNTYQNMEYSKALIGQRTPEAKVVYVTTNYHVFRSGVWASLAGLPAEGVGSRTKWWYWPNAFMRECAGLLRNRIRQEIVLLIVVLVFFGVLSMMLS